MVIYALIALGVVFFFTRGIDNLKYKTEIKSKNGNVNYVVKLLLRQKMTCVIFFAGVYMKILFID